MFRNNRKGQLIGPNIALIAATVVVLIILVVSFVFVRFIVSPADNSPAAALLQGQATTSLEAYLQTPVNVSVDGKSQIMEMSDLIHLAKINETYKSQLENKTKEIFGKVYGERYGIEIPGVMTLHNKVTLTGTYYGSGSVSTTPDYPTSARIPLPEDITVTLFLR